MKVTRAVAEEILFREARLLDELQLQEWLTMFTADGVYWVPIDESRPVATSMSLIYDPPARREERVYHVLHTRFPAQSPRSRMVHYISNVEVLKQDADGATVRSNQLIYETRLGDYTQVGLGELRPIVATVEHLLRPVGNELKIALKKILLIDRDMPQGNLTFII
jgi:3-phenylpropionate/cinnamic acid dioxygenase small subunit